MAAWVWVAQIQNGAAMSGQLTAFPALPAPVSCPKQQAEIGSSSTSHASASSPPWWPPAWHACPMHPTPESEGLWRDPIQITCSPDKHVRGSPSKRVVQLAGTGTEDVTGSFTLTFLNSVPLQTHVSNTIECPDPDKTGLFQGSLQSVLVTQSCPTLGPHGLQPARLLCPWDSPSKNTGVACHFLLWGIFPTQGSSQVSHAASRFLTFSTAREAQWTWMSLSKLQEIVMDRKADVLRSTESQRAGHNLATEQQQTDI